MLADVYFTLRHVPFPGEWSDDAACVNVDPEIFFPSVGDSASAARVVCGSCPVLFECRDYALRYPMLKGVWGGLSEVERKRLRKLRLAS